MGHQIAVFSCLAVFQSIYAVWLAASSVHASLLLHSQPDVTMQSESEVCFDREPFPTNAAILHPVHGLNRGGVCPIGGRPGLRGVFESRVDFLAMRIS